MTIFSEDLRERFAIGCDAALTAYGGSDGPASLDKPTGGWLEWSPAQLMENVPDDIVKTRDRSTGVLNLWNGGRLRPVEQIMMTVIVGEIVATIMSTVPLQRDRDAADRCSEALGGHVTVPEVGKLKNEGKQRDHDRQGQRRVSPEKAASSERGRSLPAGSLGCRKVCSHWEKESWVRSNLWTNTTAVTVLRAMLRKAPAASSLSLVTDKRMIDPCDEVLNFFSRLLVSTLARLDEGNFSVVSDAHGVADSAEGSETEASYWRYVNKIGLLLLVNVTRSLASPGLLVPRELSLKFSGGDISKVNVSSAHAAVSNLLDGNPATFWQTFGSIGSHTIQVDLKEGLVLISVGIRVDRQDRTYCPERVELSAQKAGQASWTVLCEKSLDPRGNEVCVIADNLDSCEEYSAVKIKILKNFENGNDAKVRGLRLTGRSSSEACPAAKISQDVATHVLSSAQLAMRKVHEAQTRSGAGCACGVLRAKTARTSSGLDTVRTCSLDGLSQGVDLNAMPQDSCGEGVPVTVGLEAGLGEKELVQLHLESTVRALVASCASLCISSAANKARQLLSLLHAAWPPSLMPHQRPKEADARSAVLQGLHDTAIGAKEALSGALEGVRSPLEALEVFGVPDPKKLSSPDISAEQTQLIGALFEYAATEACDLLKMKSGKSEICAIEGNTGPTADVCGRTACANFLGHLMTGILALQVWEDTASCRTVLIGAASRAASCVLRMCLQDETEKLDSDTCGSVGTDTSNCTAPVSWPARVKQVLRITFLSTCLGPLLAGLARLRWSLLDSGTRARLMEFGSLLANLASRDSACLFLLDGDVVRPTCTITCPQGHSLRPTKCSVASCCSICKQPVEHEFQAYTCMDCKYQVCSSCSFLSAYRYTRLVPSGSCSPAVWVALSANAFFNSALRRLFDFGDDLSPTNATSPAMSRHSDLLSGGSRRRPVGGQALRGVSGSRSELSGYELMVRMSEAADPILQDLRSDIEQVRASYDDKISNATKSVFLAIMYHCRLSSAFLRDRCEIPVSCLRLYQMALRAVVGVCNEVMRPMTDVAQALAVDAVDAVLSSLHSSDMPPPRATEGSADRLQDLTRRAQFLQEQVEPCAFGLAGRAARPEPCCTWSECCSKEWRHPDPAGPCPASQGRRAPSSCVRCGTHAAGQPILECHPASVLGSGATDHGRGEGVDHADGASVDMMELEGLGGESIESSGLPAGGANLPAHVMSVAEAVVSFVCDQAILCADVRAALDAEAALRAKHEEALGVLHELGAVLKSAPLQLRNCMLLNPHVVDYFSRSTGAATAAFVGIDSFGGLLDQMVQSLTSQDDLLQLSSLAAMSTIAAVPAGVDCESESLGWRQEARIHQMVSSGAWDALLELCNVPDRHFRPYAFRNSGDQGTVGGRQVKEALPAALVIHSASANTQSAVNVLRTEDLSSYWQSDVAAGSPQQRWITVQLMPPGKLQQVMLHCADSLDMSGGYAPRSVVVEAGVSPETLREIAAVRVPPNTNLALPLLSESVQQALRSEMCHFVKLRVIECGGRNCRLRGLSVDVLGPSQVVGRLPIAAVLSRAVVASVVLASCSGFAGNQAAEESEEQNGSLNFNCKDRKRNEKERHVRGPSEAEGGCRILQMEETARRLYSGVLCMLEPPSSGRDWSLAALGMGLVSACLAGPRRSAALEHADALLRALLLTLADTSAPSQILARAAALLLTVAWGAGCDACDVSAMEVAEITEAGIEWEDGSEGPPGSRFVRFLVMCIGEHTAASASAASAADAVLVMRQSVTEVLLGLPCRRDWLPAVTHFCDSALVATAVGGRPQRLGDECESLGLKAAVISAAQHIALSLVGGYSPVLMCGCSAMLPCGRVVRILAYDAGDAEAAVVDSGGSVEWAATSSLLTLPTTPLQLDCRGMKTAVHLVGQALQDGDDSLQAGSCGLVRLESAAQALRCLAQHAERDPAATAAALESAGLLPVVLSTAMTAGCSGPFISVQVQAEERVAAYTAAVQRRALLSASAVGRLSPSECVLAGFDTRAVDAAAAGWAVPGCVRGSGTRTDEWRVDRRRLWGSAAVAALTGGADAALAELVAAHTELRRMYALKAAVWMLPALGGREDAIGTAGYQLLLAAAVCGHERALVEDAVERLLKAGDLGGSCCPGNEGSKAAPAAGGLGAPVASGASGASGALGSNTRADEKDLRRPTEVRTTRTSEGDLGRGPSSETWDHCTVSASPKIPELLACVLEDLGKGEAALARQEARARHELEAAPTNVQTRPWGAAVEFPGQVEFSARCDGLAAQGLIELLQESGEAASESDDMEGGSESEGEGTAAGRRLVPLQSFSSSDEAWSVTVPGAAVHVRFSAESSPADAAGATRPARLVATCSTRTAVAESEHKYRDSVSYRGAIVLEGAGEVAVAFDPRCSTERGCDRLTFFAGPDYRPDAFSAAHDFSGSGWADFHVAGPAVYYWFRSDSSRNDWGYRFTVTACRPPPLSSLTSARLSIAAAVINAALDDSRLARVVCARQHVEALARVCAAVDGIRRRELLGCLTRMVKSADGEAELVDDDAFAPLVEQLMRAYDERAAAGEEVGTEDTLALALLVSAWCCPTPQASSNAHAVLESFKPPPPPPRVVHTHAARPFSEGGTPSFPGTLSLFPSLARPPPIPWHRSSLARPFP